MPDNVLRMPETREPQAKAFSLKGFVRARLRMILLVVVPLIAAVTGFTAYLYGGRYITTDNAYVVAQHPEKDSLREKWMLAKDRWAARAGWNLTASRVNKGNADDLDLAALLDRIEKEMPKAKPEVQWTMNSTLAAIGIQQPKLRKRALAIGEKIGLYRDWPVSKGCTPPYGPVWVEAMVKRQG